VVPDGLEPHLYRGLLEHIILPGLAGQDAHLQQAEGFKNTVYTTDMRYHNTCLVRAV